MITIYTLVECPRWIKERCEVQHETSEGLKHTFYKGTGEEVLYYMVYRNVPVNTIMHLATELETQEYKLNVQER